MTSWTRTRLKNIATVNRRTLADTTDPSFLFTYVDIGDVSQGSIIINEKQLTFAESPSRARRLAETHDTVVSTVRTYLRAVALVPESESTLVFSTGFAVISPTSEVDPQFLCWYLQGDEFVSRVEANSTGVSYPAIAASQLMSMGLNLPDFSTQRAIADFLDRETSRIDTLIAEQERLIERLRERRLAVIDNEILTNAVIPEVPLRRLTSSPIEAGLDATGDDANPQEWPRFVRTTDIESVFKLFPDRRVTVNPQLAGTADLVRNDLIATRAGTIGKTYLHESDEPACYAGYLVRIRPNKELIHPKYLAFWTQSSHFLDQVSTGAVKSTIENFSASKYRSTLIPLPDRADQEKKATFLAEQTDKIDTLISETERFIELSRERRAALITAAVTGQIDVSEEVG